MQLLWNITSTVVGLFHISDNAESTASGRSEFIRVSVAVRFRSHFDTRVTSVVDWPAIPLPARDDRRYIYILDTTIPLSISWSTKTFQLRWTLHLLHHNILRINDVWRFDFSRLSLAACAHQNYDNVRPNSNSWPVASTHQQHWEPFLESSSRIQIFRGGGGGGRQARYLLPSRVCLSVCHKPVMSHR